MKKVFGRLAVFTLMACTAAVIFACDLGGADDKEETPAYMNQAHIVLINDFGSGHNLTYLNLYTPATGNSGDQISSPLAPDYYLHVWNTQSLYGLDSEIRDDRPATYNVNDQDVPRGKILILEYDGDSVFYAVEDIADWADILDLSASQGGSDVPSKGMSIKAMKK